MWKNKWLLLLGIIFLVRLAENTSLIGDANGGDDFDPSSIEPSFGVSQSATGTSSDEGDRRPGLNPDTDSESEIMVSPTRRRRSIVTDVRDVLQSITALPLSLFQSIAVLPLTLLRSIAGVFQSMIGNIVDWGKDKVGNLMATAMVQSWKLTKRYVIPKLDEICMAMLTVEAVPEEIKRIIKSAHAAYGFAQLFGYLKST